ncbi:MAG: FixH family protein [Anaerolineae bacterium]|nr:FixH family protein [Anaerolineae bacterium]
MPQADVDIAIRVEPEPLTVGKSTLIITLTDSSDSHVDGAKLQIQGNMDHAGMTPVNRETSESSNGEYHVPFEWTMGGGWIVTVTAELPNGGEANDTFEFFVEAVSSESVINRPSSTSNTADVNITYEPDRNPAVLGEATIIVTLTDTDGLPITDATVYVVGDMTHAGMMPISGKGTHSENGQYIVPLEWTMAGDWIVTVTVTLSDGSQHEQQFDQVVAMP